MNKKTLISIAYVVALHVFLVIVFWKPGFYHRINPFAKEQTETYQIIYNNMLALQLRIDANITDHPVIFIGDSIIQGMCVSCITENSINFGIGLDTTAGVLRRISLYKSLKQAKAIVLAIGLNDTRVRSNAEILANYRRILQAIPADRPVIFSAILPMARHPRWPDNTNNRIIELNKSAEKICLKRLSCKFVNIGKRLMDNNGLLEEQYHIGDGIHPSPAGYQKLISSFRHILGQQMPDKP